MKKIVYIVFGLILVLSLVTPFLVRAAKTQNTSLQLTAEVSSVVKTLFEEVKNALIGVQGILQNISTPPTLPPTTLPSSGGNSESAQTNSAQTSQGSSASKQQSVDPSLALQDLTNQILLLNDRFQRDGLGNTATLLEQTARIRKDKFIKALQGNSLVALVSVIPGSILSKLPLQVQKYIEQEGFWKGELEINSGGQNLKYFLHTGSDEILRLYPYGAIKNVLSGALVTVQGYRLDNNVVALIDRNNFKILQQGTGSFTVSGAVGSSPAPIRGGVPPILSAVLGPNSLRVGEDATWIVRAYDPNDLPISYKVDWGAKEILASDFSKSPTFNVSYPKPGNYQALFTVSNGLLTASQPIGISVVGISQRENRPPFVNAILNKNVLEGDIVTFSVSGSDPDGDPLVFTASNLPPRASFDYRTRNFFWQTLPGDHNTYSVTFGVSDGQYTDEGTMYIKVGASIGSVGNNAPPVFNDIPYQSVKVGETLTFAVSATDPEGDLLTYKAGTLPTGAIFNSVGRTFSWAVPSDFAQGSYQATFKVSDGEFSDEKTIFIDVVASQGAENHAPVLYPVNKDSLLTVTEGDLLSFPLLALDPDGDPLTYTAKSLPQGANLNPTTGFFSWVPDFNQAGRYTVTFVVTDLSGLTGNTTVTIMANNLNNSPSILSIVNQSVNEGSSLSFTLTGTDPDGDALTFNATNLPSGATLTGTSATTAQFSWTPNYAQSGNYTVTFTATDGTATVSKNVLIVVANANRAPIFSGLGNKSGTKSSLLTFQVAASDPDGDSITYSMIASPKGPTFNPSTQVFSWTPTVSGNFSVTFRVSDGQLSTDQTITVSISNFSGGAPASFNNDEAPQISALALIVNALQNQVQVLVDGVTRFLGR